MKYLAVFLLLVFSFAVFKPHRWHWVMMLWLCISISILAGCATERPAPGPTPTGSACNGALDGSYIFINCRRTYP